jgi:hypothetical protein
MPTADWLLGDRGFDPGWFGKALVGLGITPRIPRRKTRDKAIKYNKHCKKRRNRIEIMFGRLKNWRRVATGYDRCPKVFLFAIALASTVIFWLSVLSLAFRIAAPQGTELPNRQHSHQSRRCKRVE